MKRICPFNLRYAPQALLDVRDRDREEVGPAVAETRRPKTDRRSACSSNGTREAPLQRRTRSAWAKAGRAVFPRSLFLGGSRGKNRLRSLSRSCGRLPDVVRPRGAAEAGALSGGPDGTHPQSHRLSPRRTFGERFGRIGLAQVSRRSRAHARRHLR